MSGQVPVQGGLFETDDNGTVRLIGGFCGACSRPHFPLGTTCSSCGSSDVSRIHLSDSGTLWGWTSVTSAPPGYGGPVPYGFGVVELPEGLRVISRLQAPDPERLAFGTPMKLTLETLHDEDDGNDVVTWCFIPAVAT